MPFCAAPNCLNRQSSDGKKEESVGLHYATVPRLLKTLKFWHHTHWLHTFKDNLGKGRLLFWKSKRVIILTIIFDGRDKNIQFLCSILLPSTEKHFLVQTS